MAPIIIAIRLVGILALAVLPPAHALAGGGVERLVGAVRAASGQPLPSLGEVTKRCASDTVCAARIMVRAIGPGARIEKVRHPSTDQIRWVDSLPSVTGNGIDDRCVLTIELERFGRNAVAEVRTALDDAFNRSPGAIATVVLDLRANQGGDFDRMLRVASLFTGQVPGAVRLIGPNEVAELSLPAGGFALRDSTLRVLVGPRTASSAEVLAALLRVHAGAQILGATTYGKDYLLRVVPVSQDLRLLVPAERIEVPGADLVGGLVPDVPGLSSGSAVIKESIPSASPR